jgi:tRNA nucleotidyltransferase (CCA-adding enzyme)
LTYSLDKEEIEKFIERLNFPSNIAAILVDTCDLKSKLDYLRDESLLNSKIYHILDKYNLIAIKSNFIACDNLTIRTNISLFLNKLRFINLECNGKDLKKLGIESGPVLGEILQMLHDAKINGEIANKLEELKLADSIKDEKLNR